MQRPVVALTAAGALVAPAAGSGVLLNPGFEDGVLLPWYQKADYGGPEDWNVTTADQHSGQYSATDRGNKLIAQDFDPIPVEDILELSLWIKNLDASFNTIYFEYADLSTREEVASHPDAEWNHWEVTSFLVPGKELISFGIYGVSGGATERTFVDDWVLNVVPAPAGFVLLFPVLWATRRRC